MQLLCFMTLIEEVRGMTTGGRAQYKRALLTTGELQGAGVFVHREVVQLQLALSINGQPT